MTTRLSQWLSRYFKLSESNTTVRTELLAGLTSFITVAYILILNPQIISHPYEIMGDTVMVTKISNGVLIGTYIASFVGTVLCALYAKVPFVQAPGVGLFITIIGLKNSGLVVSNPSTLVSLVDFSQWRTPGADLSGLCGALVALIGLIFIARYAFITLG